MDADRAAQRRTGLHANHLLTALIVAWLAIQLGVPVYALTQSRPTRLGWQMYTSTTQLPTVSVRKRDGSEQAIELSSVVARERAEADYATALERSLCALDNVAAVIIERAGDREEHQCP